MASCRDPSVSVGRGMAVRRVWSDVVSRVAGDFGGIGGVGPCCSVRGPMSPAGRVYGWRLASVRAVVSCAGLWWPEPFPLCLVTLGNHPVVVCGALSSAGRFWPARLFSSRLGGGELSAGGGMGKVAGGSRGRVGRVPRFLILGGSSSPRGSPVTVTVFVVVETAYLVTRTEVFFVVDFL